MQIDRVILIVMGSLQCGGAEVQTVCLANGLAENGWKVHLALLENLDELSRRLDPRVAVTAYRKRSFLDRGVVKELSGLVAALLPDVMLACESYSCMYAYFARKRGRYAGSPLICVNHMTFLSRKELFKTLLIYRPIQKRIQKNVFVCGAQKEYWIKRYGVPEPSSVIIYNGLEEDFGNMPAENKMPAPFAENEFVVGIVAGLKPVKRHNDMVEAVRRLRDEGIPVCALFLGDGECRESIEARIAELDVGKYITLLGHQRDIRPYIGGLDVVALTSAWEAFSVAALEAMAISKPLLLSDVGGARELVIPGYNGYLFPAGDIDTLCERLRALYHSEEREALGKNGNRHFREHFTMEPMVRSYIFLFDELLDAKKKGEKSQ